MFAEHDMNVDPTQNINYLNEVFDNNPPDHFTVKIMAGGQHGFYKVKDRCVSWEDAEKQSFDADFQNEIEEWVSKVF